MVELSTRYYVYFYSTISASTISIILHFIGLYAIYLHKKKSNQNVILCFLSVSQISAVLHQIAFEVTLFYFHEKIPQCASNHMNLLPKTAMFVFLSFYYTASYGGLLTMYVLNLDRFICALDPLKYKV